MVLKQQEHPQVRDATTLDKRMTNYSLAARWWHSLGCSRVTV